MVSLSTVMAEALAMDVAVGYLEDNQLCVRYQLTPRDLALVRADAQFQMLCDEQKRQLNDGGGEFKIIARSFVPRVLRSLMDIAEDDDLDPSARVKAGLALVEIAGIKTAKDGGASPVQLVINTNLALGTSIPGQYTIEASAIEH